MDWITALSATFALIGGVMLISAGRRFTRQRAFVRNSAVTSGTIVALTENREPEEISYFPTVKFKTPAGREITFTSEMGSSVDAGRVGDAVAVRYQVDQPQVAAIDSFMSLWGLTLVLGVLGVVFTFK